MSALRWTPWGVVLALMLAPATYAGVIYQDDFSSMAGSLNGATPDVGANNWVAGLSFSANGAIATVGAGGSATLAFTPVDGLIYTLDASLTDVISTSATPTTDNSWLALGFAAGQSTLEGANHRFLANIVIGKAWSLHRAGSGLSTNTAWRGSATSGTGEDLDPGTAGNQGYTWDEPFTGGGAIDMRVVLDTTGGAGAWTATWFAKLPASGTYDQVRPTTTLVDEVITSVGIAFSSATVDGRITSFRLTSQVPEPISAVVLLIGLGTLAIGRRRR